MLCPRTVSDQRTESQCKSRNILLDGVQPEDHLHGRSSRSNASKRWVNVKSLVGRRRISQLYKREDRKSVENYWGADDIIPSMEDSPREDQHQYIKEEDRRGLGCACKVGLFYSRGNGEIHPSTDESWDYKVNFNQDQWKNYSQTRASWACL